MAFRFFVWHVHAFVVIRTHSSTKVISRGNMELDTIYTFVKIHYLKAIDIFFGDKSLRDTMFRFFLYKCQYMSSYTVPYKSSWTKWKYFPTISKNIYTLLFNDLFKPYRSRSGPSKCWAWSSIHIVQYWSLLNWQNLRLRCGCVAVALRFL